MSIALTKRRIVGAAAAGLAASLTLSLAAPAGAVTTRSTAGLFGASDATYDGVYRQLKVTVKGSGLTVRTRTGYYAKADDKRTSL